MWKLFEHDPWLIEFQWDWPEWFVGKYNWKNFTLIEVSWEHDILLGGIDGTLALLGIRLRIRYTYDKDTPLNIRLREDISNAATCEHKWINEYSKALGRNGSRCTRCECFRLGTSN